MSKVVEDYFNKIRHLRSAKGYLQDLLIIQDAVNDFNYDYATQVISYLSTKYCKDLNSIGKMLTGVVVLNSYEIEPKSAEDLLDDLYYLYDCIIVMSAVHTGIEDTLRSAIIKINRESN